MTVAVKDAIDGAAIPATAACPQVAAAAPITDSDSADACGEHSGRACRVAGAAQPRLAGHHLARATDDIAGGIESLYVEVQRAAAVEVDGGLKPYFRRSGTG